MNHRRGLYDAVLIKDNHIKAAGSVSAAVHRAAMSKAAVQVEVEDLAQLDEALKAGADSVLLDNFRPARLRKAMERVRSFSLRMGRRVGTEASGGVTLKTIGAFAASGVDRISVGALTHSAPALDLSMEFELR